MNEHIVHIDNIEELVISKYLIEEELIKQKQLEKKYTLQEFIQDFLKMNDHIAVYNIIKKPEIITNLNTTKTFIEEPKKDFVVIKKGDTIYSIAKQNNVPLKDIILRNNLRAPYTLSIGDKIYIPNTAFHIVKAQDTAYSISRKYNVNLNSLVKLNKLTEPYTLSIGQKILLPATNIDVVQKQIKYVVKDKETAKTVQPSLEKEEVKEVSKIRVAQKQKIEEKPKEIQTQTEIEKKEIIKSIIVKPEPLTSKRFLWPLNGKVISQYGIKNNGKRPSVVSEEKEEAKLGQCYGDIQKIVKKYRALTEEKEKRKYEEEHPEIFEILDIYDWIDEKD